MIETDDNAQPFASSEPANFDATAWRDMAEQARRELENWARSRPRERHRTERAAALSQPQARG